MRYLVILMVVAATVTVAFRVRGHRRLALQSERRRDWRAESPLLSAIVDLGGARRRGIAHRIIRRHPELLDESGDTALQELADALREGDVKGGLGLAADCVIAMCRDRDTAMRNVEESRDLLMHCRRLGVDEVFARIRIQMPGRKQADLFEATGNPWHLRRAVTLFERAVRRAGNDQRAALCMDELAACLVHLHKHCLRADGAHEPGAGDALDEAIKWHRRAVEDSVQHSAERAGYQSNLGLALRLRYAYAGSLADLDEAIENHQEAVGFADKTIPQRHAWLNNLGNALYDRFLISAKSASLDDLDRAIEQHREALRLFDAHPGDPADRQSHLWSLSGCLITRASVRTDGLRAEADRDDAGKALAEYMLTNYVPSSRGFARGVADICARELVAQWSKSPVSRLPPAPSRAHLQEILVNRVFEGARHYDAGSAEGFEKTVEVLRAAIDPKTAGSARWAILNFNLACAFRDRAEASRDTGIRQTAAGIYRDVCRQGQRTGLHYVVMEAAQVWGTWASKNEEWREAVEAFVYGINAMLELSADQDKTANKEAWLARARELSVEGAYAATRVNLPWLAVWSFDRGRAVMLREVQEGEVGREGSGPISLMGDNGQPPFLPTTKTAGVPA